MQNEGPRRTLIPCWLLDDVAAGGCGRLNQDFNGTAGGREIHRGEAEESFTARVGSPTAMERQDS